MSLVDTNGADSKGIISEKAIKTPDFVVPLVKYLWKIEGGKGGKIV